MRKNDLTFGGNSSPHSKKILPHFGSPATAEMRCRHGRRWLMGAISKLGHHSQEILAEIGEIRRSRDGR